MEERITASAACNAAVTTEQSIPASMTVTTTSSSHSNNAALHASINKWVGLASMNTGTEEVMRKQLRHQANGVISVQSLPSNVLVSNIHLQHSEGGSEISFNALHKYHKRSNSSLTSSMGDTNSLSTTSSYKIHRSNSGSSAHAACSFENLRLKEQTERLNNISMRNQSFHAHSRSRLYSTTKSTSMANETFSIVEKGRLSSNPLLNTMLTSPSLSLIHI